MIIKEKKKTKQIYIVPKVSTHIVTLEYGIAAGSVQPSISESWENEAQSQELEW